MKKPPLRVGVSACLLGERVRFDGGHKRDAFVTDLLGRFVELVPFCPEVALGLGVPSLLHRFKLDVKIAAGPVALALADFVALVIYFTSAWLVLR